jgi:hypothetical protein
VESIASELIQPVHYPFVAILCHGEICCPIKEGVYLSDWPSIMIESITAYVIGRVTRSSVRQFDKCAQEAGVNW